MENPLFQQFEEVDQFYQIQIKNIKNSSSIIDFKLYHERINIYIQKLEKIVYNEDFNHLSESDVFQGEDNVLKTSQNKILCREEFTKLLVWLKLWYYSYWNEDKQQAFYQAAKLNINIQIYSDNLIKFGYFTKFQYLLILAKFALFDLEDQTFLNPEANKKANDIIKELKQEYSEDSFQMAKLDYFIGEMDQIQGKEFKINENSFNILKDKYPRLYVKLSMTFIKIGQNNNNFVSKAQNIDPYSIIFLCQNDGNKIEYFDEDGNFFYFIEGNRYLIPQFKDNNHGIYREAIQKYINKQEKNEAQVLLKKLIEILPYSKFYVKLVEQLKISIEKE